MLSIFALPLLVTPVPVAQEFGPRVNPLPGPLRNAGTYHLATQSWSRGGTLTFGPTNSDVLFANTDTLPFYAGLIAEDTVTDEGRLPGAGQPLIQGQPEVGTSDQYLITGFEIAFCSVNDTVPTIDLAWLEQYASCSDPTGIPEVASFELTDLPINGCWVVAIDLSGTEAAFDLAADGGDGFDGDFHLDNFGWRFPVDSDQTNFEAGVILASNPGVDNEGCGTKFKDQGCLGVHGLGMQEQIHAETPGGSGCVTITPNLYLRMFGEESSQAQAFCSPGANSLSAGGARLSAGSGFGSSQASLQVTNVPAGQPGIFFSGPTAIQLPFGCGTRCVGGAPSVRYGPFLPMNNTVEAQLDMSISPNPNLQFWYRDPDNAGACGSTFNFSDALGS